MTDRDRWIAAMLDQAQREYQIEKVEKMLAKPIDKRGEKFK